MDKWDVIVVGGGHAGIESALAAARMGANTLLLTLNLDTIGYMSCNPAIGGVGKGQLVREIDALGGEMGKAADNTGIHFRLLNTTKGLAVRSPRCQSDRVAYRHYMQKILKNTPNLSINQALVEELIEEGGKIRGVKTFTGRCYKARCVILTVGTFLNGTIHIGLKRFAAGRAAEFPSLKLSNELKRIGLELGRLKTGTSPRVDSRTINYSKVEKQIGDPNPFKFSFSTKKPLPILVEEQLPCYITRTTPATRKIIEENLDKSPLYSGIIKGVGVRYCPSIEDKIVKFPSKETHHVFIEPDDKEGEEVYLNGLSTSLPEEVQIEILHSVVGLEDVFILRPGYGIEYDFCYPTQLYPTLETKKLENLFLAGQINGTTGYEEAAAQGIIAGINAAAKLKNLPPLILGRDEGYIGVLIDDLVTKGTQEPYRMFTSRAEYRLLLRCTNADLRLSKYGYKYGLIDEKTYSKVLEKARIIGEEVSRLKSLKEAEILKDPEKNYDDLPSSKKDLCRDIKEEIEAEIKYEGYIKQHLRLIEKTKEKENLKLPESLDYRRISGLSREAQEKLNTIKPHTLGAAMRIPGIRYTDILTLLGHLKNA